MTDPGVRSSRGGVAYARARRWDDRPRERRARRVVTYRLGGATDREIVRVVDGQ